jgi:hypothetical protein
VSVRLVVSALVLVVVACATGAHGGPGGKADTARGQKYFMAKCNACHPNGGAGAGPTIVGKLPPGPLVKGTSGRHAVPSDEFDSLIAYITPIMQPQAAAPAAAPAAAATPAATPAAAPAVAPAPPGFKNCNCNCQCPLNTPPGQIQNCTCSCACPPG